jgi:hypothetical protein
MPLVMLPNPQITTSRGWGWRVGERSSEVEIWRENEKVDALRERERREREKDVQRERERKKEKEGRKGSEREQGGKRGITRKRKRQDKQ